jgi:hypothetical protein
MRGFEGSSPEAVIVKALGVSVVVSISMLLTSLGFMYLFSPGTDVPLSTALLLVVFAISFVAAAVLLERASDNMLASFMGGGAIALSATVFVVALVSGVYFLINIDKMVLPGMDMLLTGFAICLISSLVINRLTLKL